MNFLIFLIIASLVGTILWIIQNILKPVTQKFFSQTWHYYTSLIPIIFFLGGTKVVTLLIDLIGSVLTSKREVLIYQPTKFTNGLSYITKAEQYMEDTSPINQLFTILTKLENRSEIMLWVFSIWVAGVIFLLVLNFKRYVSFKHFVLQNHRFCNINQTAASKVIISVNTKSPMAMGILKPVVILPDINFNEKELTMILSHELTHIKRGDLFIKLIIIIAKAVHWFNPFIYLLSRQLNDYCEVSCDEKVVQKMDTENRRSYGEMILSILDYGIEKRSIVDIACVSNFCTSKNNIKWRLLNIMNSKKMKKTMTTMSILAIVLLIGVGAYATYGSESKVFGSIIYALESEKLPVEDKVTVVHEDTTMSEEFDITNKALEEYLNSIEGYAKKALLEKYFYLPSELIPEENKINNLDPVKQAEIMSKLSIEELKDIVDKMEANIPGLKKKKEQEYNDRFKYPKYDELSLEVDVPFRMKYQDPYAEPTLDIDIQAGDQVLTGDDAEAYLKFRKLSVM
ncbi:MAG: hypothetical protein GX818_02605 [Tissierellia bacterium]|nr:hypothetical protein [Tissierellia bacterium]